MGGTSILLNEGTGQTNSTSPPYIGEIFAPGSIDTGETFDSVVLKATILDSTTTPFTFNSYAPGELNRSDLMKYVMATDGGGGDGNDGGGSTGGGGGDPGTAPVPEPATMLLFGAGLAGLAGTRRYKNSK